MVLKMAKSSICLALKSYSDDRVHLSVRPRFHGDAQHAQVCQQGKEYQEQGRYPRYPQLCQFLHRAYSLTQMLVYFINTTNSE